MRKSQARPPWSTRRCGRSAAPTLCRRECCRQQLSLTNRARRVRGQSFNCHRLNFPQPALGIGWGLHATAFRRLGGRRSHLYGRRKRGYGLGVGEIRAGFLVNTARPPVVSIVQFVRAERLPIMSLPSLVRSDISSPVSFLKSSAVTYADCPAVRFISTAPRASTVSGVISCIVSEAW